AIRLVQVNGGTVVVIKHGKPFPVLVRGVGGVLQQERQQQARCDAQRDSPCQLPRIEQHEQQSQGQRIDFADKSQGDQRADPIPALFLGGGCRGQQRRGEDGVALAAI